MIININLEALALKSWKSITKIQKKYNAVSSEGKEGRFRKENSCITMGARGSSSHVNKGRKEGRERERERERESEEEEEEVEEEHKRRRRSFIIARFRSPALTDTSYIFYRIWKYKTIWSRYWSMFVPIVFRPCMVPFEEFVHSLFASDSPPTLPFLVESEWVLRISPIHKTQTQLDCRGAFKSPHISIFNTVPSR